MTVEDAARACWCGEGGLRMRGCVSGGGYVLRGCEREAIRAEGGGDCGPRRRPQRTVGGGTVAQRISLGPRLELSRGRQGGGARTRRRRGAAPTARRTETPLGIQLTRSQRAPHLMLRRTHRIWLAAAPPSSPLSRSPPPSLWLFNARFFSHQSFGAGERKICDDTCQKKKGKKQPTHVELRTQSREHTCTVTRRCSRRHCPPLVFLLRARAREQRSGITRTVPSTWK